MVSAETSTESGWRKWSKQYKLSKMEHCTETAEASTEPRWKSAEDGANHISAVLRVEDWRWSRGDSLTEL